MTTTDQAELDRDLQGLTCDGYLLKCNFARMPLAILKNPDLSAGAIRAYGLMLWYLHKGARYPGHAAASVEFNIPTTTLRRHLKELEAAELIMSRRHGQGLPNSYHLPDPRLLPRAECPKMDTQDPQSVHQWRSERPNLDTQVSKNGHSRRIDLENNRSDLSSSPQNPDVNDLPDHIDPATYARAEAALQKVRDQQAAHKETTP